MPRREARPGSECAAMWKPAPCLPLGAELRTNSIKAHFPIDGGFHRHEKRGGATSRRPASLRIRVESPVSRDGGWTGQFNVWTRSCASVNGPNPILMSENVGECAHPESRGPRSRGRRVQTLLSLLCSLDSPPLPVALWVATMFSVTLFVPPRRLPYSVLFSLSADGWFLPADGTKPTSRASRSASSRLECTPNRS